MIRLLLRIGRQTVSLPISAKLTEDDVQDVIAEVFRVLGGDQAVQKAFRSPASDV